MGHLDQAHSELARFFVQNVDKSYISHGEVQDGRAQSLRAWQPKS